MTVVSTKEFNTYQEKYFDMAVNGNVCIKRGEHIFYLSYAPIDAPYPEQEILEPDDDLLNAIPMTEVRDKVLDYIRRKNAMKS
jgi:hypothetical protein